MFQNLKALMLFEPCGHHVHTYFPDCLQMHSVTNAHPRMYSFTYSYCTWVHLGRISSHQQIQQTMQAILMPAMWGT